MSELNKSSHCNQSSKTVGRMSESEEPAKVSNCEEIVFSKRRKDYVKNPLVAKWCFLRHLDVYKPVRMGFEFSGDKRTKLGLASLCYQRFMSAYDKTRCVERKRSNLTKYAFWTTYRGEHPDHYKITNKKLKVLDRQYFLEDEENIGANFSILSGKLYKEHVRNPLLPQGSKKVVSDSHDRVVSSRKKYKPQSGTAPLACLDVLNVMASVCTVSLIDSTAFKNVFVKEHLGRVLTRLEQEYEFVYIVFVLVLMYSMCWMAVDCLKGVKWLYKSIRYYCTERLGPNQQRWYGCSPKYQPQSGSIDSPHLDKVKTAVRMFSLAGTILGGVVSLVTLLVPTTPNTDANPGYKPQSGLNSDDGNLFTGRASPAKKIIDTSTRPASSSAPGIQATPTKGGQPLVPQTPPRSKKDPNDGPLNGFGVGI